MGITLSKLIFFPFFLSVLIINKGHSYWIPNMDVTVIRKKQCINLILNILYNISVTKACQMKLPGVVMVSGTR